MTYAFTQIGQLFEQTACWALNDLIGRELIGEGLATPPGLARSGENGLADAFSRMKASAIETAGATYSFDKPEVTRKILITLFRLIGRHHPLFEQAADAFECAAFGCEHPLIQRAEGKRQRETNARELWHFRRQAIGCVAFLHGCGLKKKDARVQVSDRWGVSIDALEDWEAETARRFGAFATKRYLATERAMGAQLKKIQDPNSPEPTEKQKILIDAVLAARGPDAMRDLGRRFTAAKRGSNKKSRGSG